MQKYALTGTQEQVLEYIKSFLKEKGYPPTRREIADCFLFYPNAAEGHLLALEKKGVIKITRGISRGIQCLV